MTKDRIIGIILMVIGVIFLYLTYSMDFVAEGAVSTPRTFPYIACTTIFVCGVAIFIRNNKEEEKATFTKEGYKNVLILLLTLFVFPFLIELIGFIIVLPIVVFGMVQLFAKNHNVKLRSKIIFTLVFSLFMYILFVEVLGIIFPMGILEGIL